MIDHNIKSNLLFRVGGGGGRGLIYWKNDSLRSKPQNKLKIGNFNGQNWQPKSKAEFEYEMEKEWYKISERERVSVASRRVAVEVSHIWMRRSEITSGLKLIWGLFYCPSWASARTSVLQAVIMTTPNDVRTSPRPPLLLQTLLPICWLNRSDLDVLLTIWWRHEL